MILLFAGGKAPVTNIAARGNWMRNCLSIHQRLVLFAAKQNAKDNSTNWVYEFRASMSIKSLGKFIEEKVL